MRKPRHKSEKPDATYHIMSRAAQQERLFTDIVKKAIVEPWFRVYVKVYYVTLHSEAEMTNHGHGLITVHKPAYDYADLKRRFELLNQNLARPRKWHRGLARPFYKRITDLSNFMRDVKWRISWEYNKAHGKMGHLWDGPFKSLEVKGDRSKGIVDSYIQQNPVKAKLATKPSAYPYCTAGRIKAAMDRGEEVEAPAIGVFAKIKDKLSRCKAYIAYHDWMAYILNNSSEKQELPPPEVVALGIPSESWEEVCLEVESRAPINWWAQTYEGKPKNKSVTQETKKPP